MSANIGFPKEVTVLLQHDVIGHKLSFTFSPKVKTTLMKYPLIYNMLSGEHNPGKNVINPAINVFYVEEEGTPVMDDVQIAASFLMAGFSNVVALQEKIESYLEYYA